MALRDFAINREFDQRPNDPRMLANVHEHQFFAMFDHGIWLQDEDIYVPTRQLDYMNT